MFQSKSFFALLGASFFAAAAWAQDYKCTSWEAFPEGASKAQEYHTIYRDDFKAKNWAAAYKNWSVIFPHVSSPKEAPSRHFEDGIKMCKELAKASTDPAQKEAYAKQLVSLYENMQKCIPAKITAYELGYQGKDMEVVRIATEEVIKTYERALSLVKNNDAPYFVYSSLVDLVVPQFEKSEKYNKAYMLNLYNQCKTACEIGMKLPDAKAAENFQKAWESIKITFAKIEDKVFDCNYYKEKLQPEYDKLLTSNPTAAQVKDIYDRLRCPAEDELVIKIKAKYTELRKAEEAGKFNDYFTAADDYGKYILLNQRNNEGDAAEAVKFLEKALENKTMPDSMSGSEKAKSAYRVAYRYYDNNNFSTARSWCRRASDYNPNWGEPYILVGLMYASSGKLCGPGTGWDSQVVVWAAMDEWQKAKSVDAGAANDANKYIGRYREYLPAVEEGFQRGIKEGSDYKIGCWIGTTTTVRLKK